MNFINTSAPPFADIYSTKKAVCSLEFFPPKTKENLSKTEKLISELQDKNISYMTVTYGAGGGTREFTKYLVKYIHRELHKTAVAHLTCVNHTVEDLRTLLSDLKKEGIRNILALRGDLPPGESFNKSAFTCARDLISFIKKEGDFSIACAGYPEGHLNAKSEDEELKYLKEKQNEGAEVIITQLFFDPEMYFRFRDKTEKYGITIPIVPGIMPISDYAQLERFTSLCGASIPQPLRTSLEALSKQDVITFGTEYASQMCSRLLQEGAPGIHFYTLNKKDQVHEILRRQQNFFS